MAGCRIVNSAVQGSVEKIKTVSEEYRSSGEAFISDLNSAIAEMEGGAKDALQNFIDKKAKDFIEKDLPDAVKGMSDLLEANRTNFVDVDQQIADSISGS